MSNQASLSITNTQSLLKLMSIESVMPSNPLILCRPLLLLPSIFPNIRVFSNKSALCIKWQKYWGFSFNISPSNERPGLISFRMDWFIAPNMILHILTLIFHNIHLMFNQYVPSCFQIFFPFIKFMEITLHLLFKVQLKSHLSQMCLSCAN